MADNENRSFEDKDATHGKDTPAYKADPGQPVLGDDTGELSADGETQRISEDEVQEAFRDQGGGQQQGQQGQQGQSQQQR